MQDIKVSIAASLLRKVLICYLPALCCLVHFTCTVWPRIIQEIEIILCSSLVIANAFFSYIHRVITKTSKVNIKYFIVLLLLRQMMYCLCQKCEKPRNSCRDSLLGNCQVSKVLIEVVLRSASLCYFFLTCLDS